MECEIDHYNLSQSVTGSIQKRTQFRILATQPEKNIDTIGNAHTSQKGLN